MSRENVELIKTLQPTNLDMVDVVSEATAGPAPGRAGLFADDFEVRFISGEPGVGDFEGRGVRGLAESWREWLTPYKSYLVTAEDYIDAGDEVIAFVRVQARTKRDDVLVEYRPAAIWRFREGKIAAIHFYLERETALEAAGITEELAQKTE